MLSYFFEEYRRISIQQRSKNAVEREEARIENVDTLTRSINGKEAERASQTLMPKLSPER